MKRAALLAVLVTVALTSSAATALGRQAPASATYVQSSATDGYSSLLSWGDISAAYGNRVPLLSVNENGAALTGGPRVLAPGDVRGGRYVSGTLILTVVRAKPAISQRKGC